MSSMTEAITKDLCTPDFIRGVKYAIELAKVEQADLLAEADDLVHDGDMTDMMDEIDALEGQAQAVQGVISKLQLRLCVMEAEGWIPEPEHLAVTRNSRG